MARFEFRLQKVLEYRGMVEQWAKEAYLDAQRKVFDAEAERETIRSTRQELLSRRMASVEELVALNAYVERLDDQESMQDSIIRILTDAVESAKQEWIVAKQEAEALVKLRDGDLAEWTLDQDRKEQAELDEMTVLRWKQAS
jgi:flagellar export protein FliJ